MAAIFLNLSTGCDALKAEVMRIGGQELVDAINRATRLGYRINGLS